VETQAHSRCYALYGMFEPVATLVVCGSTMLFFFLAVSGYDPQRGMLRRTAQPA
jgi:ABC-2 type transport system permease protein